MSVAETKVCHEALPEDAALPFVQSITPETMTSYFTRLRERIDTSQYEVKEKIEEDGLYIGKRPIIGAQGQGQLLNQAGTVFYHTLLYVKKADKVTALDFGPTGLADVTANVMEAAPCGPVVHENAVPDIGQPLLRVKLPTIELTSEAAEKAIRFIQGREYHAIHNNCIHNTDFLGRVLTRGLLRGGPLVYDALAGKVPEQDHPMLLMFFLMTQLSWFHVCDGSSLTSAFMEAEGLKTAAPVGKPSSGARQAVPDSPSEERLREQQVDLMKSMLQGLQARHKPSN